MTPVHALRPLIYATCLLGAICLSTTAAKASISLVETATGYASGATFANSTSAGHLIVVLVQVPDTMVSVSDNKGNTYTLADNYYGVTVSLYYLPNTESSAGITTITVSSQHHTANGVVIAREYSGLSSNAPDVYTHAIMPDYATAYASGSTSTTNYPSELVIGWGIQDQVSFPSGLPTWTLGTGFGDLVSVVSHRTNGPANAGIAMEDMMVSTAGTQAATFTVTSSFEQGVSGVATFH